LIHSVKIETLKTYYLYLSGYLLTLIMQKCIIYFVILTCRLLYTMRRKSGYRNRGARVVEENPFPRTRAQSIHVRDDHNIVGVCTLHGTACVRFQKDHDDSRQTDTIDDVVNVVMMILIVILSQCYRNITYLSNWTMHVFLLIYLSWYL